MVKLLAIGIFVLTCGVVQAAEITDFISGLTTLSKPLTSSDDVLVIRGGNPFKASPIDLDPGIINVKDYGAVGNTVRKLCPVASTSGNSSVTISSPCSFSSADNGKNIVIYLENATTPTSPLATTISTASGSAVTLGANAGQTLVASFVGNTHGTTTIDGIASTTGLVVGQTLFCDDCAWGTVITGKGANSVTINQAATGSHNGLTVSARTWVTWGTDDSTAINNAYTQATKFTSSTGKRGFVYFPPLPNVGSSGTINCWGVANPINIAPDSGYAYTTSTTGAGRYASQVCALASMAELVNGPDAFTWSGHVIRDIGFDGNMLATITGLFTCLPSGHFNNVGFYNPAPGGEAFKIGNGYACNTTKTFDLFTLVDNNLYTNSAQYPSVLVDIDNTDTQHYGLIAAGKATTASVLIGASSFNTILFSPHIWGTGGTYGIRALAYSQIYDPQIDYGPGPSVGIDIGAAQTTVHGGHIGGVSGSVVGVQVESGIQPISVSDFYCGNFGTPANCIKEITPNTNNLIYGSLGTAYFSPAYVEVTNQSPNGPSSSSNYTFMGLGVLITPTSSGVLNVNLTGSAQNNTAGNGIRVRAVVGTGTTPINGQSCTTGGGSTIYTLGSPLTVLSGANNQNVSFPINLLSQTQRRTVYWVDMCAEIAGSGTVTLSNVDLKVKEDGFR